MSNSVLCAVDVSHPGMDTEVIQTAYKLAKMDDVKLDVVTVVPNYGMSLVAGYFDDDYHKKVMAKAKELLNNAVAAAIGEEANKDVRHIVTSGSAYEEILGAAKKVECRVIVIGAHKPDLRDYLLGPNAARVVRHSLCSVYVVRPAAK